MKKYKKVFLTFYPIVVLLTTESIASASYSDRFASFDRAADAYAREYCRARQYGAGYNEAANIGMTEAERVFVLFAADSAESIHQHIARKWWKNMLSSYSYKIDEKLEDSCPSYLPPK